MFSAQRTPIPVSPTIFPPFGLSDHNTVLVIPKERTQDQFTRKYITTRDVRESNINALGRYFNNVDWSIIKSQPNCESKLSTFENLVKIGMNNIMPEKLKRVYPKDSPWMTVKLKNLIQQRQSAFHANKHSNVYKALRNAVNRERKSCKAKYYSSKVEDLKGTNPKQWWKAMKKLSGLSKKSSTNLLDDLSVPDLGNMSNQEIANAIDSALLEPLQVFDTFDQSTMELDVEDDGEVLEVCVVRVCHLLRHLNKYKSPGPDNIPNWLLKEYAELLADPITDILNTSFKEQRVPITWRTANITPIPKVRLVTNLKNELRPISLTPCLSKMAEELIVNDYIKPAVLKIIDPRQFGTVPGSSTVMALISMFHKWLGDTDGTGSTIRVLLCDYSKAFDLIDHRLLVNKIKQLDIPNSVIIWVISFLTCRLQRVKLGYDCFSEWGAVPSGVPQGTKLGPWLFLIMINDLSVSDPFSFWKYVDDSTVSETVIKGNPSEVQLAADQIHDWSKENKFQLNCDKTKELTITFTHSHQEANLPPIHVEGNPIRTVTSAKLLGVTINSKLSWNDHIANLVAKASRKLYFLVQLKRAKVSTADMVAYYCTCIRSSLDYACQVFHHALPKYLRADLERIQKRAMRCIFPHLPYSAALVEANINSVNERHCYLTAKLFKEILENHNNKLNHLIPKVNETPRPILRKQRPLNVPRAKTDRFFNSFIVSGCRAYNDSNNF